MSFTIRCPNCQSLVDTTRADTLHDVACADCGSHFSLLLDETLDRQDAPRLIGKFELLEILGAGSFGTVWKARDTELDRLVAIKLPHSQSMQAGDQEVFLREARAAAQLRHPNIVGVHEVGRHGDLLYIVCDFISGVTLADWLSAGKLTPRESAAWCLQLAQAVAHAHAHGIIHRDLKPGNILVSGQGGLHILDFGLAKRLTSDVTVTVQGVILGTPAYMSPEQARGDAHLADERSDIYSLGVILYQLLTGELPFRGNMRMMLYQVMHDEPRAPRRLNDRVPASLEAICLKAMAKEPRQRYASAAALAADLERFLNGDPVRAQPAAKLSSFVSWCCKIQRIREAGSFLMLLGTILILWTLHGIAAALTGAIAPHSRWSAVMHFVVFVIVLWIPLLAIARGTIAQRLPSIVAGIALLIGCISFSLVMQTAFPYDFGGIYGHYETVLTTYSLFTILASGCLFYYVVALVAYIKNPNAVRWAREAGERRDEASSEAKDRLTAPASDTRRQEPGERRR